MTVGNPHSSSVFTTVVRYHTTPMSMPIATVSRQYTSARMKTRAEGKTRHEGAKVFQKYCFAWMRFLANGYLPIITNLSLRLQAP